MHAKFEFHEFECACMYYLIKLIICKYIHFVVINFYKHVSMNDDNVENFSDALAIDEINILLKKLCSPKKVKDNSNSHDI